MIEVGIIGGTGYVAGELLRLLVHHPEVHINFVYSHSQPGTPIAAVHEDLFGTEELRFTDQINPDVDAVFLCLGHGNSKKTLEKHRFAEKTKIIDLGNDFRLQEDAHFQDYQFVYGLPELNRKRIREARAIANPGCFATAIQLGLLPLAKGGLLQEEVHIHALTGSTGAGRSLSETSHFSWRNNNLSIYKAFRHQHLGEITESVRSLQADFSHRLNFLPLRGDFTRGIFASLYLNTEHSETELRELYTAFYRDAPFTQVTQRSVHLKQVVNTNFGLVRVEKIEGKVLITSVIDNLLKGASGQAVQNLNLLFGLPETCGLQLKAAYF